MQILYPILVTEITQKHPINQSSYFKFKLCITTNYPNPGNKIGIQLGQIGSANRAPNKNSRDINSNKPLAK